jgi:hypothetical protein
MCSLHEQLIFEDAWNGNFVMMGGIESNQSSAGKNLVCSILNSIVFMEAKLPSKVLDDIDKIACSTLGEAHKQKLGIWWLKCDTIVTQVDGCTYSA